MPISVTGQTVSVVIPNYNGEPCLSECLDSLVNQTYENLEVILVDNASVDGSATLVETRYPNVRLTRLPSNRGFAAAVNAGISVSRGQFVVILNNDTRAEPDFIQELFIALQEEHSAAMAAPKMLFARNPRIINSLGLGYNVTGSNHDVGFGLEDSARFGARNWVFGPCGGAGMFRRSLIEDAGPFDEDFFMYYEDVDYSFRAQLLGYKCIFVPTARIYHEEGASGGSLPRPRNYYFARNSVAVILRNFPTRLLLKYLPTISWEIIKRALSPLRGGDLSAILGYAAAIGRLGATLKKRRLTQTHRRVADSYIEDILLKNRSIVKEINLRGRPVEGLP
ncbi:MAG: glycosyltransferase family 2 protein [Candidatus Lindowbacteria bacterium]|nr:glycosyltransferase family 2 protein [Candidatus Lindowbacteria bacterium]